MASYFPPTENLPIFDDSIFIDTVLTVNTALNLFITQAEFNQAMAQRRYTVTSLSNIDMQASTSTTQSIIMSNVIPSNITTTMPIPLTFRYTYTQGSGDSDVIFSQQGVLQIFITRCYASAFNIASSFGIGANANIYNMVNTINGAGANYSYTDATYSPRGRQYFTTCPNGGNISGYGAGLIGPAPGNILFTQQANLYINGTWTPNGNINGVYKIGFHILGGAYPVAGVPSIVNLELELLTNPYSNISVLFSNT